MGEVRLTENPGMKDESFVALWNHSSCVTFNHHERFTSVFKPVPIDDKKSHFDFNEKIIFYQAKMNLAETN